MSSHSLRILRDYDLHLAHWAILSTASYYLPISIQQLMLEVQMDLADNYSEIELLAALHDCCKRGLINHLEFGIPKSLNHEIVLTNDGSEMMEAVNYALRDALYTVVDTVKMD